VLDWDPAGRTFDLVTAGITWHWIEPTVGASQAVRVLRRGGRLAIFWNIAQLPPDLAKAVANDYRQVAPDMPYAPARADPLAGYQPILAATTDAIRATDAFDHLHRHDILWERAYTTEEWLAQTLTFGGHSRLPRSQLSELLDGIGAAIRNGGGAFSVAYTALAITADRR
jgi:alkanesulfonate monooxygenase SsuD/methylene tetrahydromethanopterin reductase-like flavin-dependent oxidoreductase (luciferase family)